MHRSLWIPGLVTLSLCFVAGIIVSRVGFDWSPHVKTLESTITKSKAHVDEELPNIDKKPEADEVSPEALKKAPVVRANMPPEVTFKLEDAFVEDDAYHIELEDGYRAVLTIDPVIQDRLESLYRKYEVPHAGFVAVEPKTGRVLAVVSHESSHDSKGDIALESFAPSASLFKIITAAALIEDAALTPASRVCYHGNTSKYPEDNQIQDNFGHNRRCTSFAEAFGESNNPVFASLAYKNLTQNQLETWAARFGYNEAITFQLKTKSSTSEIPADNLKRARAAAGFRHTYLSPLHASLIVGAIGNGGVMMRPNLIETLVNKEGEVVYEFKPSPYKRVMEAQTARKIADLMVRTTTIGTASKHFHKAYGLPENGFTIGGKTGTLSDNRPYLMYSWFAGLAPVENPQVAVAALVCNPMKWRIKGSFPALEGIRAFVDSRDLLRSPEEDKEEKDGPEPHELLAQASEANQGAQAGEPPRKERKSEKRGPKRINERMKKAEPSKGKGKVALSSKNKTSESDSPNERDSGNADDSAPKLRSLSRKP